jgi:hypothetical protein
MLDPLAGQLGVQQTRDLAHSALPGATVQADTRPASTGRVRRIAAFALHRLADRLEPAPRLSANVR